MKKITAVLLVHLLLPLAASGCALRRGTSTADSGAWDAVVALPRGTSLMVELDSGLFRPGRMAWADANQLVVAVGDSMAAIGRTEIARVFRRGRDRQERAGIGFLAGAAAGYAGAMYFTGHLGWGLRMGVTWGAIGAGIGASMGDDQPGRLVYASQQQGRPRTEHRVPNSE